MKKFAKILSLVLVLALVLSLCACGEKKDGEKKEVTIVGKWSTTMDMDKMMAAASEESDREMSEFVELIMALYKGVSLKLNLTLNEDGTYVMAVDEASMNAAIETMSNNIKTAFPEYAEFMDVSEMAEEMGEDEKGTYRYEDGKLYMTPEDEEEDTSKYWVVELSASELKITDIVGEDDDDESYKALLPLIFTK